MLSFPHTPYGVFSNAVSLKTAKTYNRIRYYNSTHTHTQERQKSREFSKAMNRIFLFVIAVFLSARGSLAFETLEEAQTFASAYAKWDMDTWNLGREWTTDDFSFWSEDSDICCDGNCAIGS